MSVRKCHLLGPELTQATKIIQHTTIHLKSLGRFFVLFKIASEVQSTYDLCNIDSLSNQQEF